MKAESPGTWVGGGRSRQGSTMWREEAESAVLTGHPRERQAGGCWGLDLRRRV